MHPVTGESHYWDNSYYIWDDHLSCYVDNHGEKYHNVKVNAPVSVMSETSYSPKLDNDVRKLNDEFNTYNEALLDYIDDE